MLEVLDSTLPGMLFELTIQILLIVNIRKWKYH